MKRTDVDKVLIIGSGPMVIGQACEFDYSGTQACKALRACGYKVVLVNSNPATIMTDPVMADATYIEPLNEARLEQIIEKERPDAILPNLGGQTGLNLSMELAKKGILDKYGVKVIGVNLDAIERGEDREVFKKTMEELGIDTPKSGIVEFARLTNYNRTRSDDQDLVHITPLHIQLPFRKMVCNRTDIIPKLRHPCITNVQTRKPGIFRNNSPVFVVFRGKTAAVSAWSRPPASVASAAGPDASRRARTRPRASNP